MMGIIYGLIAFILICIFLILYVVFYNQYQTYIIRINEAETFIDTTLRKRFDLLNKSIYIFKSIDDKEEYLKDIEVLKEKKINNFELDRVLYESINEFNLIKEKHPKVNESTEFIKIELSLIESESEIVAARKYYKDIITDYNELRNKFPTNIVGKISGYKIKNYFDGKEKKETIKL